MKIATFNCNSIRKRLPAILKWLKTWQPDALILQETKVRDEEFPAQEIRDAGWHVIFRGEKSYNGVAIITKEVATSVSFGLGDDDEGESQTRLAALRLGEIHLINTYVPQGAAFDSPKFQYKLQWFKRLRHYFEARFDPVRDKVLWAGDLNVAPAPIDVHDSKKIWPHVCHGPEVIDAFAGVTSWGFTDVFRKHLPEAGYYTFWDYRVRGALERGLGWRIDHILATPALAAASVSCRVDITPRQEDNPSDHTFVLATFED